MVLFLHQFIGSFLHVDTRGQHARWHGGLADRVLVEKKTHRLTLLREGEPIRTYRIALGRQPVGPKQENGGLDPSPGPEFYEMLPIGRFVLALILSAVL